jgi:hypothetical protein
MPSSACFVPNLRVVEKGGLRAHTRAQTPDGRAVHSQQLVAVVVSVSRPTRASTSRIVLSRWIFCSSRTTAPRAHRRNSEETSSRSTRARWRGRPSGRSRRRSSGGACVAAYREAVLCTVLYCSCPKWVCRVCTWTCVNSESTPAALW